MTDNCDRTTAAAGSLTNYYLKKFTHKLDLASDLAGQTKGKLRANKKIIANCIFYASHDNFMQKLGLPAFLAPFNYRKRLENSLPR